MSLTLSPWWLLALAVPIVLAGQAIVRRVPVLAQFNVPVSVVGGLSFAALGLLLTATGVLRVVFETKVTAGAWTWLVTPEPQWAARPAVDLNRPLLIGFFTCIGLGAPWHVLRRGGRALVVLVGATAVLALLQNVVGAAVAAALGQPRLLGVVCGALSLVGGVGTVGGLAPDVEAAGLPGAVTMGIAAATFGLIAAGVLAGPLAEWLLRGRGKAPRAEADGGARVAVADWWADVRWLAAQRGATVRHLVVLALCLKAGAWLNLPLKWTGLALPVYMGALLTGFALRVAHDVAGGAWLRDDIIGRLAVVLLALFLAVTLAPLNLAQLADVAGPMLAILLVNVALSLAFAALVVWWLLGRDYEAAVMTAGFVGFGVGSTGTAVAAMDAIVRRRGAAPRAFALVPPIGGFVIDYPNAAVIAWSIAWLK